MRIFDEESLKEILFFLEGECEEVEGYLYETESPKWSKMAKINNLLREISDGI